MANESPETQATERENGNVPCSEYEPRLVEQTWKEKAIERGKN